jgi:hypothetical protein
MIKYLEHNYINLKKYDDCIRRDAQNLVYGLSWYLSALCPHWDALVLNDYDAVLPLPYKVKWGIKYFYRPFGLQQLGVFSKKKLPHKTLDAFILKATQQVRFFDLFLNQEQQPEIKNVKLQAQQNQMLNLAQSYQSIYKGYSQNLKRKLKKIDAKSLQLFENDGPDVVISLFKDTKGKSLKLSEHFYRNMKKVMYLLFHKGTGKVYSIYGGPNSLMAAVFVIEHQGRCTLLSTAVSEHGKEYNAMAYLINEYIIFKAENQQWLDFEGSNNPGIARFNHSFGAQDFTYWRLYYSNLPNPINWIKRLK